MADQEFRGTVLTECRFCNGTGLDDADWSGRCFACDGEGLVEDDDDQEDDDGDG
jgi:DnaJ-class molecular chaperone